jgi:iron(III) transport system ATP-binding protein
MVDYLIEAEGALFRTQVETHAALARGLVLGETEPCRATFQGIHWFEDREAREGR